MNMTAIQKSTIATRKVTGLQTEYPEGIPQWMLSRGWTEAQIREAMNLRRFAFPATHPAKATEG
jgi:hypothetical protein